MKKFPFFLIAVLFTACYSGEREFRPEKIEFVTLGNWDTKGVPNYLCERASNLDTSLANNYFSTFISREDATQNHPVLFDSSSSDLVLKENTDLTISFLMSEASNTNVMGYYVYPTNKPPASPNDVKDYVILFPNVTIEEENVLLQGDKICIDGLSAGTSLGFFIVVQGWKNNELNVGRGQPFIFSNPEFNKVNTDELKQKSLLLYDEGTGKLVLTFEALTGSQSDNDYDDAAVIIGLSNPNAVDTSQLTRLPQ